DLIAIDDALFEPVALDDGTAVLTNGIAVETAEAPRRRWVRSGRRLHVFSERADVSAFASVGRAIIGQENVILCEEALAEDVLAYCRQTETGPVVAVTGPGIPDGWKCFRGFRPRRPAEFDAADEIFLALNPHPDAQIEFSGGISLSRGIWLAGN